MSFTENVLVEYEFDNLDCWLFAIYETLYQLILELY